jgi:hypothetical protein
MTRRAHPLAVVLVGALFLAGIFAAPHWIGRAIVDERRFQKTLQGILEQATAAGDHRASLETLKTMDLEQLKAGLGGHALSQKSLFESGFSLQEERRLLEKQLEIMTTYLLVDPAVQRIFLLRDNQPLQSYLIGHVPLKAFGNVPAGLPSTVRIVSKERFAHPERGKSEESGGTLQWVPPQVGTSVRSRALGEFVMFTNSALILHGPPVNADDHERFPHICLGLDREAARKLYRSSFIGTKIALQHVAIDTTPTLPPLAAGTTQAR